MTLPTKPRPRKAAGPTDLELESAWRRAWGGQWREWQPGTSRKQAAYAGLAVVAAVLVFVGLLMPRHAAPPALPVDPPPRPCEPGQSGDCAGGRVEIYVLPPQAPAVPPAR